MRINSPNIDRPLFGVYKGEILKANVGGLE